MAKKRFKLIVEHDDCVESPNEWGSWKVASFNRRHVDSSDPQDYFVRTNNRGSIDIDVLRPVNIGFARKLQVGTAFILSYSEHGLCRWSLSEEGPQCQWDTTSFAGVITHEANPSWSLVPGDRQATYRERQEDARQFLATYTEWCNGSTFVFRLVNVSTSPWDERDDEDVWTVGLIGCDDLEIAICDALGDDGVVVTVEGEQAYAVDGIEIPRKEMVSA